MKWCTAKQGQSLGGPHTISQVLVVAGFVLVLWVVKHPYWGVIHDARYYLLQTLYAIDPVKWKEDLFFQYGSQDTFSIFSNSYKWFVSTMGIAPANLLAIVIGDGLWLSALSFLACTTLKRPAEQLAAVCGVIALSTAYGSQAVLHYAEPFLTPRLFAEAAVMGSLAFVVRRQYFQTSILCLLAFSIHPLTTLPGIGIIIFEASHRDRRTWIILGLTLLVLITVAGLGIDPFSKVLQFYTTDWFHVASERDRQVLISTWNITDYANAAFSFIILGAFYTVANDNERRATISILVVTLLSCTISFLGADIAHNVLITGLQLWRSLWLTTLVSNAAIFLLLLRADKAERTPLVIAIIFSFLPGLLSAVSVTAPFIAILCLLWFLRKNLPFQQARFLATFTILISIVFTIALVIYSLYLQLKLDQHIVRHLLNLTLAMVAIFGLIWSTRHHHSGLMPFVAIGTLIASIPLANQQSHWNQYVYSSQPDSSLTKFLTGSGTTFWLGDKGTELLWFKVQKPSYFSCLQGAESLFFHPLATEWSRRRSALQLLNTTDFSEVACKLRANSPDSEAQVAAACQALSDLDTIVLNHAVPGLPGQTWTAPTYQEVTEYERIDGVMRAKRVKVSTFYRYNCADLRKSP